MGVEVSHDVVVTTEVEERVKSESEFGRAGGEREGCRCYEC